MFKNIFKPKRIVRQISDSFKDPNQIIGEIHAEFDSATDRLLKEAKEILSTPKDTSIGKRLGALGFASAKETKANAIAESVAISAKTTAESIEYCQQNYPNYKYITEEAVKAICKKYGLVFGDVTYFKGVVPEKNISDIEAFQLKDNDKYKITYGYWKCHSEHGFYVPWQKDGGVYGYVSSTGWGQFFTAIHDENEKFHYDKPILKICAAISDFDTSRMRVEDGYKLENIPDPIVLQPIARGGYLIVTKWGLEASDELVVNEKMN